MYLKCILDLHEFGFVGTNTLIKGVSAVISTAALLATKIGIPVGTIYNFAIVGSDIECYISNNYTLTNVWEFNNDDGITAYYDYDGKVTELETQAFYNPYSSGFTVAHFPGVTKLTGTGHFDSNFGSAPDNALLTLYIPNCIQLGASVLDNTIFRQNGANVHVTCDFSLQTVNGGNPDGDLQYVTTAGGTITYIGAP